MRNERGAVLLIVAAIIVAISAMVNLSVSNFDANLNVYSAYAGKKKVFYMAEGARALSTVLLQQFLMNNPSPTNASVKAFLDEELPKLIPAPFTISPVDAQIIRTVPNATLTTGPFKGMNGPITDLALRFSVSSPNALFGSHDMEALDLRLSIGYISMFQFMVFYDTPRAIMSTGPDMEVRGRLHANSDLCIGGSSGWETFLKITAGGRLMNNIDTRCAAGMSGTSRVRIATDQTFTSFQVMANNYDNGCTNCNGSGLDWDAFAVARWNEQALDQAHGVQILKLPGAGMGLVQRREAGNANAVSNNNNLRFIVDPPLVTDSPSVKSYKFSHNSDIRIINGVWYLKNPSDPQMWPGVPIWSDHPGRYIEHGVGVGQEDIRDRWAGAGYAWPAAPATPGIFSYYEYDSVNRTVFPDTTGVGVISYGVLYNSGVSPTPFKPGQWLANGASSTMCLGGAPLNCGAGPCGFVNVFSGSNPQCTGAPAVGRDPSYAANVLNATRGGFRNGHINQMSSGSASDRRNRSRILPVNIDVQQLQNALASTDAGELGSYFGAGRFMGRAFNGVLYISSEYPGSLNGFGTGYPEDHPWQGSMGDAQQIGATHTALQQALPQALCSTSLAGDPYDLQGAVFRFRIPNCASYVSGGPIQAHPNAIRVVNGATLSLARLPRGLSIVSNLPVYILGNYNTSSNVSSVSSTPWVPALVGGDKVAFISNNWTDGLSRWDQEPSVTTRNATTTTYNTAMLSEPSIVLSMFLENWDSRDLYVNGSMVYGYDAVYAQHDNLCCGNQTYDPPDRHFEFDPHFGLITNQPPGTPVFPVSAVAVWAKTR